MSTLDLSLPDGLVTFRMLGQLGRLGNQLFQVAGTLGVARRNGFRALFPPWRYAGIFLDRVPQQEPLPTLPSRFERSSAFEDIILEESADIAGFLQSQRYFEHCIDEIRQAFTPHPALLRPLLDRFGGLLERDTCSIHVRRTDYVSASGASKYINLSATTYYQQAVA